MAKNQGRMKPFERETTDENALERVLEVLAGRGEVKRDGGVSKMVAIVHSQPSDLLITPDRFEMQWVASSRRRPHSYSVQTAPGVVFDLMRSMGVDEVKAPLVGVVAASPAGPFGRRYVRRDRAVWFLPGADELKIYLREVPGGDLAASGTIPASGVWALPEPALPWEQVSKTFRDNASRSKCPHCAHEPDRFRQLGDAVVCPSCWRSFQLD